MTEQLELDGNMVVRRLRAEDAELLRVVRLAALEDSPDAFGETLAGARLADWQERAVEGATLPDRAVFIALVGRGPIGMVFVKCAPPAQPAFLGAMWVSPQYRQRGVGRALVQHGLEFLRRAGQTEVSLWVTRGHDRVLAFYRSLGCRETGATSTLRHDSPVPIDELSCTLEEPAC